MRAQGIPDVFRGGCGEAEKAFREMRGAGGLKIRSARRGVPPYA